ncbi:MAG TPA: hypothetical protein VM537_14395, partial [Anaerolineae bacterium]|nr:hypothetical protein [Anaerolineae bacterium]
RSNPAPPHSGPQTSKAAAITIWPTTGTVRRAVLDLIADSTDGLTCDDVEAASGLMHQNASARIWELRGKNRKANLPVLLVDSGRRRATRSGSLAVVWVLAGA